MNPKVSIWIIILRMALNLLGIKQIALETVPESGFMPSVERCRDLITSKTSAIVLVTPNNPVSSPSCNLEPNIKTGKNL